MIYINIEMPIGCNKCFAKEDDFTGRGPSICKITNEIIPFDMEQFRPEDCPLKEKSETEKEKKNDY
jgi:hypothetical protein